MPSALGISAPHGIVFHVGGVVAAAILGLGFGACVPWAMERISQVRP
jgi:hypothetical protein